MLTENGEFSVMDITISIPRVEEETDNWTYMNHLATWTLPLLNLVFVGCFWAFGLFFFFFPPTGHEGDVASCIQGEI